MGQLQMAEPREMWVPEAERGKGQRERRVLEATATQGCVNGPMDIGSPVTRKVRRLGRS